jgi:hypothetical protein
MQTVWRWLRENADFRERYARAKEESADALSEDIKEIGEKTLKGEYDPQAARVAIDSYKWVAAKLKPKVYGDRIDMTSGGEKLAFGISAEQSQQLIRARANRSDPE